MCVLFLYVHTHNRTVHAVLIDQKRTPTSTFLVLSLITRVCKDVQSLSPSLMCLDAQPLFLPYVLECSGPLSHYVLSPLSLLC